MPTISVIVPVYKVEKYIHRCVDSILGQTFEDFELILVDDGSPDNCGAICDEYATKDGRVIVIHQENGGLSAARNAGIDWAFANSDSQWLTFIDSDDWVHPEMLEYLLGAALNNDVGISVCTLWKTTGKEPNVSMEQLTPRVWATEDFFITDHTTAIPACGKLYRRTCFTNIRYPVGRLHEDEFTTHQLLFQNTYLAVIPVPLYYYYHNDSGITKSQWNPRRLDALDAIAERVDYFWNCGKDRLFYQSIGIYLSYVHLAQKKIREIDNLPQIKEYERLLRQQVRNRLHDSKCMNLSNAIGLYEFAYPALMRAYWLVVAAQNKIKKLFRKQDI